MFFRQIADPELAQYAYLIGCQKTGEALLIDPERDVDRYLRIAEEEDLEITSVAETHIHADFLSGARELASRQEVRLYLSDEGPDDWKYEWAQESREKGDQDVHFLEDGDSFRVGNIEFTAFHSPGHTPEHMSFLVTDHGGGAESPMGLLSGDFLFVGDLGRPDLLESAAGEAGAMEPAARQLYHSVQKLLELPDYLQVWPAHGAGSACGKALGAVPSSTLGYEKLYNPSIEPARRGIEPFVQAILEGQPEPPLYFGRMKDLNKEGPPILGRLPDPPALGSGDFAALLPDASESSKNAEKARESLVVLDTRGDRGAFFSSHLPGSLFAPLGSSLSQVAGSFVDPEQEMVLIVGPEDLDNAVRGLVRIGLDRFAGYLTPQTLEAMVANGSVETVSTPTTDFAQARERMTEPDTAVLDVRGASEYEQSHLPGAVNIAYTRLVPRASEIPQSETLLVHCQSGRRASFAASMLERMGHSVIVIDDAYPADQATA